MDSQVVDEKSEDMDSQVVDKKSGDPDLQVVDKKPEDPDPKRQKLDTDDKCEKMSPSSDSSSCDYDSEDSRLFKKELERSGPFDFDSTKVGRLGFEPVVFEETYYADEPETDGELMERLSKIALKKYNDDNKKEFELVRVVKANCNVGVFFITLEAKDDSLSQPIIFQATVRHLPLGSTVYDVRRID